MCCNVLLVGVTSEKLLDVPEGTIKRGRQGEKAKRRQGERGREREKDGGRRKELRERGSETEEERMK